MIETFYGDWKLSMDYPKQDNWRIFIEHSEKTDGYYDLGNFQLLEIKGARWQISIEYNLKDKNDLDHSMDSWVGYDLWKTVSFTSEGFQVNVNPWAPGQDQDTPNVVFAFGAQVTSMDPALNPMYPILQPFDFTFPKNNW